MRRSARHRLLARRLHLAPRPQPRGSGQSRTHLQAALQGRIPDPARVRPQSPLARRRARHHHGDAHLGPESGTAHPRPLHRHRRSLEPGPAKLDRHRAQGIPVPNGRSLQGFPREVSRLPHRRPSQGRAAYARPRWSRRQPRLRMFEDLASIEQLGGLYQGPVRAPARCWPISGATPTRPPSATTVSSSSTRSTSASGGATTPTATRPR